LPSLVVVCSILLLNSIATLFYHNTFLHFNAEGQYSCFQVVTINNDTMDVFCVAVVECELGTSRLLGSRHSTI
jgi:hypothetical protein